jgi:lysophospholipase L1-like esterase
VAIQFAISLAVLLAADVFLWLFFPASLYYDRTAVEQHLPGVKSQIVYAANQYGFRSLSMRQEEKPVDALRIFCLGASTTDQANQNTEDTWCALLEQKLSDEFPVSKIRFETASFGRGGWKASDLYVWARTSIERFRPDVVIILMGINDLALNGGPMYSYTSLDDIVQKHKTGTMGSLAAIKDLCKAYSQVCRRVVLTKWRLELVISKNTGRVVEWSSKNLPELRKQYRQRQQVVQVTRRLDPIVEFSDAMDELLSLLKKAGIEVLVLGQPVLWKEEMTQMEAAALWLPVNSLLGPVRPSTAWLLAEMHRYNDAQSKIAARYGAPYVDLDSEIPKTLEYYFDDCHYTDAGSRLVASIVFSALKERVRSMASRQTQ